MTQQWNPTGGRFDVEPLENINEVADLPDLAQLDEAQIYSIRSGEFAPDYIVPWAWDSTEGEYQEWRSTVDGQVISDIVGIVLKPEENDLDHFTGDTGGAEINSDSPILFDDLSLKASSTGFQDRFISTTGLERYPEVENVFSVYTQVESGGQPGVLWGVQDYNNFYQVIISTSGDEISIGKDGLHTHDDTIGGPESVSLSDNTWYEIEVEWHANGDLIASIYDIDQSDGERQNELGNVTANDTDYTSGGIGFGYSESSGSYVWDRYSIIGSV